MAAKSQAATVAYKHDDVSGEHQLGISKDGVFVPVAGITDQRFNDRFEALKGASSGGEAPESEEGGE